MRMITGIVRRGAVELDDKELPDGTPVVVIPQESDETFELSPAEEEKLLAAIREVELGRVQSGEEVLRRIRRK